MLYGRTVLLLGLLLGSSLFAEPRQWDVNGVPVRAVRFIADFSTAARDDGTTLVVWAQSQGSDPVVLGQLLAPDGTPLWPAGGILLASGQFKAGFPIAAAVDGGWVVLWLDSRLIASDEPATGWYGIGTLRAVKINDDAVHLWNNGLAGVEVVPESYGWLQKPYALHRDGGGVIINYFLDDHWALKLSANGVLEWPEPVLLRLRNYWEPFNTATDPAGGVLFAWYSIITGDTILFANKLLSNGTFAWNDTAGVEVHRSNYYYRDIRVCTDRQGGMFVTWGSSGDSRFCYAQHLSSTGSRLWQDAGVLAATLTDEMRTYATMPSLNGANVDGLLIALKLYTSSGSIHAAQKIRLDGTLAWGDAGILLCEPQSETISFEDIAANSDAAGGMICSYVKADYTYPYVFENLLLRINSNGERVWGDNCGVSVSGTPDRFLRVSKPGQFGELVRAVWIEGDESAIAVQTRDLSLAGVPVQEQPQRLVSGENVYLQDHKIVELDDGATAVVWEESKWFYNEQWFQMFDAFGAPRFAPPGRRLVISDEEPYVDGHDFALAHDGNGGFFALFESFENGYYAARAVHIDREGNHVGPAEGVTYEFPNTVELEGQQTQLYRDGSGGCFVTAAIYDVMFFIKAYTFRINSECALVWPEPVIHFVEDHDTRVHKLGPGADGSVVLSYAVIRYPNLEEHVARISADGEQLWDVVVGGGDIDYSGYIVACSDRNNGMVVVWDDYISTEQEHRLYAQRISPDGQRLWITPGLQVAQSENQFSEYSCSADQLGNVTVAWSVYLEGGNDLFAQRISAAGTILWGEEGIPVCEAPRDQSNPMVYSISDNEVYILWRDYRNSTMDLWEGDLFGTHLDARGRIRDDSFWQTDGSPICNYPYNQYRFSAVDDLSGGLVVAWMDDRTSLSWEYSVFAQRLFDPIYSDADESPVVVTEFSLSQNYPNPFNPETVIEFALPVAGEATLKVYDVTGREVATLLDQPLAAGVHRANFDASRLPSGLYFYRLDAGPHSMTRKMVLLR